MLYVRLQIVGGLACQNIQNNGVGDQLCVRRVLLHSSGQSGFGFGETTQVNFRDSLANDGQRGGGAGAGCEFFVDVEGRLVVFTSLYMGEPE